MKVTIKCKTVPSYQGVVYASMYGAEGLIINATIDYCIDACRERNYVIENAQEVLEWLQRNAEFKAYRPLGE